MKKNINNSPYPNGPQPGTPGPEDPKQKKKRLIERILFVLCLVVFIVSAVKIGMHLITGYSIKEESSKLTKEYVKPSSDKDGYQVDFDKLLAQNPDTVAWVDIPGTSISYPVVYKADDNEYYLRRSFEGKDSIAGCIFLDGDNKPDFSDNVNFIFGHNVDTSLTYGERTFFTALDEYEDKAFFDAHRKVNLTTKDGTYHEYEVLAVLSVPETTPLYQTKFDDKEQFQAWIDMMHQETGLKDSPLTTDSNILILATCQRAEAYTTERRLLFCYRK
ncbi:MAG: class B sortase [Eubacteriales bacterium]|nr:class B sortase [Eubacteriales bacterium]